MEKAFPVPISTKAELSGVSKARLSEKAHCRNMQYPPMCLATSIPLTASFFIYSVQLEMGGDGVGLVCFLKPTLDPQAALQAEMH